MSIVIVEHASFAGAGHCAQALRVHGFAVRVVRRWKDEPLPVDADDLTGLVLGDHVPQSSVSMPGLEAERRLIGAAQMRGLPIVGLGFGARLVAATLGGSVAPIPSILSGWASVSLTHHGKEDPLFAGQPWLQAWWTWSSERVAALPPTARPLATVGHDPVAFVIGTSVYGFTYHWEWTRGEFEGALKGYGADLGATTAEEASTGWTEHGANTSRLAQRQAVRIAQCLFLGDRQHLGRPRDIKHA
ncbi:MAG: hypothetical protein O2819_02735 [Planctomycetota bacterium]|nr:hypothetical protein [Planctomycetota bacterium]MDA1105054.1 hypothetical protein [Planctomycetota bacterium]